jgi:hypothetical protein
MARRAQNALSLVSLVRKAALWFLQTQGAPFQNHRVAFPQVPDSLLIFGAGHGFEVLTQAAWLTSCQVYYWGDIDTHGFAILDQPRAYLPHVLSLLMDRDTLLAFKAQWGREKKQTLRDLSRLNAEERALYDIIMGSVSIY